MKFLLTILLLACLGRYGFASSTEQVTIVVPANAHARIVFGTEKLKKSLESAGFKTDIKNSSKSDKGQIITIGLIDNTDIKELAMALNVNLGEKPKKEGFAIYSSGQNILITGSDESGVLYGCLEVSEQIKKTGKIPVKISMKDQPEMVLRGACIGIQKPYYLPGRTVYEYPYTPENFPWFYDKALWIKYLDMLVENRMNSLYLWNGHPFASLVKLKDYPYAVEVDDATFQKNEEMFGFLTKEADRRGIWVIQMFYNILVSKPFAELNGINTQDRKRPITPLISDYTRKSIAAFVEKYPNVGLLITLGEAMEGDDTDVEWFTKTILPGVKDGLAALGTTLQPPVVLRGHDTNPQLVMKAALPMYKNLYTMNKYNGEALTTYQPRGPWAKMHKEMSESGSTHIDNVHILANLEPFRYGSADFIQKSVQAMHDIHGANGLHLYPEASYWDWPYSADNVKPRQLQIDRDWVWYKAWARYAWNCRRDRNQEVAYWTKELGDDFDAGSSGKDILEAYEQAGEITPKLLRRFGITNGNRQTLTLGMTMSQFVNPGKYRVWPELYNSDGPEGEKLTEFVEKEWKGEKHIGETPVQIIDEVVKHGKLAVDAIERAAPNVRMNKDEFDRVKNDIYCNQALADFFSEKVKAASLVIRYGHSKDITDLEKALPHLEKSVVFYEKLAALTRDTYLYANSMQTAQRRIPVGGDDGKNKTWVELLPFYKTELGNFRKNISELKAGMVLSTSGDVDVKPANIVLQQKKSELYNLEKGARVFADMGSEIKEIPAALNQLKGIRYSSYSQTDQQTVVSFKNEEPVKVLVGYFQTKENGYLTPPNLETDASANDFGQAEVRLAGAIKFSDLPEINVHTYYFKSGENKLVLGKGKVLILGFMNGNQELKLIKSVTGKGGNERVLDWLFE